MKPPQIKTETGAVSGMTADAFCKMVTMAECLQLTAQDIASVVILEAYGHLFRNAPSQKAVWRRFARRYKNALLDLL